MKSSRWLTSSLPVLRGLRHNNVIWEFRDAFNFMANLEDERWIKSKCHTTKGPYLQPFAPNPSWRNAEVFIVGLNPITSFREEFDSFDHYWQSLTSEPELYEKTQQAKYLKQEAARSRTSLRIAELTKHLSPLNTLVTNVFSYPSTNPSLIPQQYRREPVHERIISRLLVVCKPKVLLFHGAEARKFASMYFSVQLDPYLPPEKQNDWGWIPNAATPSMLLAYHHLVGRVDTSEEVAKRLKQFAKLIRRRLNGTGTKSVILYFTSALPVGLINLMG